MQQWFGAFDQGFLLLVRLFLSLFGERNMGRQDIEEVNSMLSVPMLVSRYRQTTKKAVRPFFSWSAGFDGGSLFGGILVVLCLFI